MTEADKGDNHELCPKPPPTTFVRQATGLVREISFLDFLGINSGAVPFVAGIYISTYSLAFFPGVNVPLSILITLLILLPTHQVVYGLMSASMPRSGGDYVFISRILHPSLGFGATFVSFWANALVVGFVPIAYVVPQIAGAIVSIGLVNHNPGLVSSGLGLGDTIPTYIIGIIVILFLGAVAFLSTKYLMRVIVVTFIVGIIGILVGIAALLSFHGDFPSLFNNVVSAYSGQTNVYQNLIQAVQKAGYSTSFSWTSTLETVPLNLTWMAYAMWSTYNAGEFKKGSSARREYWSMTIILLVTSGLVVAAVLALQAVVGSQFYADSQYAYYNLASALPLPIQPSLNLFAGMVTGSTIVTLIASVGTVAIALCSAAILYPALSRILFAWSFDRLLPEKFSETHSRFGTPYFAVLTMTIFGIAAFTINSFLVPALFTTLILTPLYSQITFEFGLAAISAVVFVFFKKNLYNESPARKYHPLLAIAGLGSATFLIISGIIYFTNPFYGIITSSSMLVYTLSIFIVPTCVYFLVNAYRKSKGIDVNVLFKQIPPE